MSFLCTIFYRFKRNRFEVSVRPLCDFFPYYAISVAYNPQAIMDIFGWLSLNGKLQLIIYL